MSPNVSRFLLCVLGGAIAALPLAFPTLAPFQVLFASVGSALGGGAVIPRPGDAKGGAK
jgi:hypothetical protein